MAINIWYFLICAAEIYIICSYYSVFFEYRYGKMFAAPAAALSYIMLFTVQKYGQAVFQLLVFAAVNILICALIYKGSSSDICFHAVLMTALMCLSHAAVFSFLMEIFYKIKSQNIYFISDLSFSSGVLILYILVKIIVKTQNKGRASAEKEQYKKRSESAVLLMCTVPALSVCVCIIFVSVFLKEKLSGQTWFIIFICSVIFLAINVLMVILYRYLKYIIADSYEMKLKFKSQIAEADYYRALSQRNESQKIIAHDIKNHLNTIRVLNEQGETEEIKKYIDSLVEAPKFQRKVIYSDNIALNSVLQKYLQYCEDNKINFQINIGNKSIDFLNYDEVSALFGNLVENAAEAASKVEPENLRFIDLSVIYRRDEHMTIITVQNSCCVKPLYDERGAGITSKWDKDSHGYGTKSIAKIVKKYNGKIRKSYIEADKIFCEQIYIDNKEAVKA